MAAIAPSVLQKRVKELMKLNENRLFKKDARAFKTWLSEYMNRYGEFELLTSAKSDRPQHKAKAVAVVNVDKVPLTNFQSVN
ncbi:hypothetical protein AaE_002287, partial [Aphanomyces astaci]